MPVNDPAAHGYRSADGPMRRSARTLALLACTLAVTGCGAGDRARHRLAAARSQPVVQFPDLDFAVDQARLGEHLEALMAIAEAHDGVRTVGTPGYEASVDYVAEALRGLGWRVETPSAPITTFRETAPGQLEVGDATFDGPDEVRALIYSASGDVTGPVEMLERFWLRRGRLRGLPGRRHRGHHGRRLPAPHPGDERRRRRRGGDPDGLPRPRSGGDPAPDPHQPGRHRHPRRIGDRGGGRCAARRRRGGGAPLDRHRPRPGDAAQRHRRAR